MNLIYLSLNLYLLTSLHSCCLSNTYSTIGASGNDILCFFIYFNIISIFCITYSHLLTELKKGL
jgi:hypothetical protein